MGGVAFPLKVPEQLFATEMDDAHQGLWPNCHLVRGEGGVEGPVGRSHLTIRGFHYGHSELLVSRYVDTDIKAVPSDGWYILMKNITSIFILMATTLINLLR